MLGEIFTPRISEPESKTPAVVWLRLGETAASIESTPPIASRGLVAMIIDYRELGRKAAAS
jgi:hypothetical protein